MKKVLVFMLVCVCSFLHIGCNAANDSSNSNSQVSSCSHHFVSAITKASTCKETGVETYTCSLCGDSYTEEIQALEHSANNAGICIYCNERCVEISADEIQLLKSVKYISQKDFTYRSEEKRYLLSFSLLNTNEEELKVPATVEITIKNDNGEEVYASTKNIEAKDFLTWSYLNGVVKRLKATIIIEDSEIEKGTIETGKIYFKVYKNGYFSFDTSELSVSNLPLKESQVVYPEMPQVITHYSYTSFKVTSVILDIDYGSYSRLYITGEKLYDIKGVNYSRGCKIGYKIYDSDGYIVDSGVFTTQAIKVGEKIKNAEEHVAYKKLIPGETYRIELLDVE